MPDRIALARQLQFADPISVLSFTCCLCALDVMQKEQFEPYLLQQLLANDQNT